MTSRSSSAASTHPNRRRLWFSAPGVGTDSVKGAFEYIVDVKAAIQRALGTELCPSPHCVQLKLTAHEPALENTALVDVVCDESFSWPRQRSGARTLIVEVAPVSYLKQRLLTHLDTTSVGGERPPAPLRNAWAVTDATEEADAALQEPTTIFHTPTPPPPSAADTWQAVKASRPAFLSSSNGGTSTPAAAAAARPTKAVAKDPVSRMAESARLQFPLDVLGKAPKDDAALCELINQLLKRWNAKGGSGGSDQLSAVAKRALRDSAAKQFASLPTVAPTTSTPPAAAAAAAAPSSREETSKGELVAVLCRGATGEVLGRLLITVGRSDEDDAVLSNGLQLNELLRRAWRCAVPTADTAALTVTEALEYNDTFAAFITPQRPTRGAETALPTPSRRRVALWLLDGAPESAVDLDAAADGGGGGIVLKAAKATHRIPSNRSVSPPTDALLSAPPLASQRLELMDECARLRAKLSAMEADLAASMETRRILEARLCIVESDAAESVRAANEVQRMNQVELQQLRDMLAAEKRRSAASEAAALSASSQRQSAHVSETSLRGALDVAERNMEALRNELKHKDAQHAAEMAALSKDNQEVRDEVSRLKVDVSEATRRNREVTDSSTRTIEVLKQQLRDSELQYRRDMDAAETRLRDALSAARRSAPASDDDKAARGSSADNDELKVALEASREELRRARQELEEAAKQREREKHEAALQLNDIRAAHEQRVVALETSLSRIASHVSELGLFAADHIASHSHLLHASTAQRERQISSSWRADRVMADMDMHADYAGKMKHAALLESHIALLNQRLLVAAMTPQKNSPQALPDPPSPDHGSVVIATSSAPAAAANRSPPQPAPAKRTISFAANPIISHSDAEDSHDDTNTPQQKNKAVRSLAQESAVQGPSGDDSFDVSHLASQSASKIIADALHNVLSREG